MANLAHVSTREPTYWPSDRRKVPDLTDFAVMQCIPINSFRAESSFDLSLNHSPVLITLHSRLAPKPSAPTLSTKKTGKLSEPLSTIQLTPDIDAKHSTLGKAARWALCPKSSCSCQVVKRKSDGKRGEEMTGKEMIRLKSRMEKDVKAVKEKMKTGLLIVTEIHRRELQNMKA